MEYSWTYNEYLHGSVKLKKKTCEFSKWRIQISVTLYSRSCCEQIIIYFLSMYHYYHTHVFKQIKTRYFYYFFSSQLLDGLNIFHHQCTHFDLLMQFTCTYCKTLCQLGGAIPCIYPFSSKTEKLGFYRNLVSNRWGWGINILHLAWISYKVLVLDISRISELISLTPQSPCFTFSSCQCVGCKYLPRWSWLPYLY